MSRRRLNTIKYSALSQEPERPGRLSKDNVDGFDSEQFKEPPERFPWQSVLCIVVLALMGTVCLACAVLIGLGFIGIDYHDRLLPLSIIGILTFIPGGYYGFVLACTCLKREGYTAQSLPHFNT